MCVCSLNIYFCCCLFLISDTYDVHPMMHFKGLFCLQRIHGILTRFDPFCQASLNIFHSCCLWIGFNLAVQKCMNFFFFFVCLILILSFFFVCFFPSSDFFFFFVLFVFLRKEIKSIFILMSNTRTGVFLCKTSSLKIQSFKCFHYSKSIVSDP